MRRTSRASRILLVEGQALPVLVRLALVLSVLVCILLIPNLVTRLSAYTFEQTTGYQDLFTVAKTHEALVWLRDMVLFMGIVTAVLWIPWQWRIHARLRDRRVPDLRFGPALGAGSWLVPVLDVAVPFLAMHEAWRRTEPDRSIGGRRPVGAIIICWWAFFLAMVALALAGFRLNTLTRVTVDQRVQAIWLWIAAGACGIVAALAAIVLVTLLESRLLVVENAPEWRSWGGRRAEAKPEDRTWRSWQDAARPD